MKKFKRLSLFVVALVLLVTLTSCGKISQSYADKLNKAAEEGNPYTFTEVNDDLGDDGIWLGTGEKVGAASGVLIAVKGCDDINEVKQQLDEGKTVKGLIVVFAFNKATNAKYTEITQEDLK